MVEIANKYIYRRISKQWVRFNRGKLKVRSDQLTLCLAPPARTALPPPVPPRRFPLLRHAFLAKSYRRYVERRAEVRVQSAVPAVRRRLRRRNGSVAGGGDATERGRGARSKSARIARKGWP